jgi:hypothetical protein
MAAQVLTSGTQVLAVIAFAVVAVASVWKVRITERSRTERLRDALKDTKPHQRAGIIMAFGLFEKAATEKPDAKESASGRPAAPKGLHSVKPTGTADQNGARD